MATTLNIIQISPIMSGSVLKGIIGLEAYTGHLYYAEVRYESGTPAEAGRRGHVAPDPDGITSTPAAPRRAREGSGLFSGR